MKYRNIATNEIVSNNKVNNMYERSNILNYKLLKPTNNWYYLLVVPSTKKLSPKYTIKCQ